MISPFTEKIELLIKSLLENNSFAVVHYTPLKVLIRYLKAE